MTTEPHSRPVFGRVLTAVLVAAAVGLSIYVVHRVDTAPRTDDAYAYADTVNVAPEVNGRIVDLRVTDNQAVHKGDILLRIDPRPYLNTLDRAQATLVTLEQEIMLTQRTVNAQKFAADSAQASVDRARALADQATDTRERMEPLLGRGFVSAEALDQAKTAEHAAKVQLQAAEIDAKRAKAAISGVEALEAKRNVIKAEIAQAQLNLDYTTVKAPCDGYVVGLKIAAGQYAAAGHPLFTLVDTERWYVVANFRETELANIRPGNPAQVYLLSEPGLRYQGQVESVGFGVFPEEGGNDASGLPKVPRTINWVRVHQRFPVRILISHPDLAKFRLGESAVATVNGLGLRTR